MEKPKTNVTVVTDRETAFTLVDVITERVKKHVRFAYIKLGFYLVVSIFVHIACVKGGDHLDSIPLIVTGWILPFIIFIVGLMRVQPSRKTRKDTSINALLEDLAHLALKEVYKEKGLNKADLRFEMGTSVTDPFRMFGTVKSIQDETVKIPLMIVSDKKSDILEVVFDGKAITAEAVHIELEERKFQVISNDILTSLDITIKIRGNMSATIEAVNDAYAKDVKDKYKNREKETDLFFKRIFMFIPVILLILVGCAFFPEFYPIILVIAVASIIGLATIAFKNTKATSVVYDSWKPLMIEYLSSLRVEVETMQPTFEKYYTTPYVSGSGTHTNYREPGQMYKGNVKINGSFVELVIKDINGNLVPMVGGKELTNNTTE